MKNLIAKGAAIVFVASALAIGAASEAQAHTPTSTASCSGITLNANYYESGQTNQWSMTVNGVTRSGTFSTSFSKTIPVPQEHTTSTYTVSINVVQSNQYDYFKSGSVGPCGTLPPPPPPPLTPVPPVPPTPPAPPTTTTKHTKTHIHVVDKCNCYRDKVTLTGGPNVKIQSSHPSKLLWVFTVTGKKVGDVQYLLPETIGGHSGWAVTQVYKIKTTNTVCPCQKHHNCHQLYPNYTPPTTPCRGSKCHD